MGVDVPNATVMLIEHAERFGLSQLHQLRGRVGRGSAKFYCLLINTSGSAETADRLRVLEQSQDGFWIAEMDMRLRGAGEVLGISQSGLPNFAIADLSKDGEILEQARQAAEKIISKGDRLKCWNSLISEMGRRSVRQLRNDDALN